MKNLWNRFVRWLKKVFGVKPDKGNPPSAVKNLKVEMSE